MQTVLLLNVQGTCVHLRAGDPGVGQMLGEIVDYFGLPVAETSLAAAQASLDMAAWEHLPPLPADARPVTRYGRHVEVWRSDGAFFLQSDSALVEVNPATGRATGGVVLRDDPALRSELLADVVLALFLLLRPHRFFPLHAAALARNGEGVLFAAESDTGKSTTAYNLVRQGWTYLSDDSVLLRPRDETVEAIAFRRHFGMDPDARERFPEIAEHWSAQLTDVDKRCVALDALYPDQSAERCVPRLLIFPELVDEAASRLVPLRSSDALLRLIAQSALVTLDPEWTPVHLGVLKTLLDQAPPYRLLAAPDLLRDPHRIVSLLDEVWPTSSSSNPALYG